MMKLDFRTMAKGELRAYVITHPEDRTAFHIFVDRFTAEASAETFNIPTSNIEIEQVEMLIKQRLEQLKSTT